MAKIDERVKAIIADKLGLEESLVKEDANFQTDLGADSLDTVEMIMEFEKEFGISIPDEDTQKIATVGDAIAYVQEKVEEK
jgi:acyl carrier protein